MKKWIKVAAAVWMTVAVSGVIRIYGLEDVIFFNKGLLSLCVFFLGLWIVPAAYDHWKEDKRSFLAGYAMALALTFTEILGTGMRLEVAKGEGGVHPAGIFIMASAAVILAVCLEPCFHWAIGAGMKPSQTGWKHSPNRIFLIAWGILFLGYLPCVLAFCPGLYCYDMVWQWAQFASRDFSAHHPLIHTLFAGGLIELGKILGGTYNRGILLHSLVQILILSGSMAYALRFLVKRKTNLRAVILTGAFFLFFPYFPVMGISTTKDTIFAALLLVVFVCVCDMVENRKIYRGWRLGGFLGLGVLMCLFRNNAVYGLAVFLCCLCLLWGIGKFCRKKWDFLARGAFLTMACILLSQGMFLILEKGLDAAKGGREEMMSLPMQQMARAYVYHEEAFSPQDQEALFWFFDEDAIRRYKYYVSDPVKAGMRMENFELGGFIRLWARIGKQFPAEYIKAPLYNMMGLWYMGGDSSCYMEYKMSPPFDEEHRVEIRSRIPWLKDYYSWFTDENLQRYLPGLSLFFYTAFYSWCVILAAGVLAAKRKYLHLLLPLFLACYGFTLVFGPCVIIRYFLGIILCIPVLAVMTFEKNGLRDPGTAGESE